MTEKYKFSLTEGTHPPTWKGVVWGGFGAVASATRLGFADVASAIRDRDSAASSATGDSGA